MRWPWKIETGAEVARRLEREYDDARATVDLAHSGDATVSRRALLTAEARVIGYEAARLAPTRDWRDHEEERQRAARREAQVFTLPRADDPPTERIHTRGAQS